MSWLNSGNVPSLIISDIQMPEIDGWEFIENLRNSLKYDSIPIIVLSGSDPSELEIACRYHGVADYLRKPFDPTTLLEKIRNVLSVEITS